MLAAVVGPLAGAGVSVFASATFDTDYFLIQSVQLESAMQSLTAAGHSVRGA